MNVALANAEGLPGSAYVSIRVGETRRQAAWRPEQKFHFPGGSSRSMHVDVFEKLGSAQVSLAGIGAWDGSQNVDVGISRADGSVIKLGLNVEVPSSTEPLKETKPPQKEAAKKAVEYMERSGAQRLLSKMVQTMMLKQPEDPVGFMADFIAEQRTAAQATTNVVVSVSPGSGMPDLSQHYSLLAEVLKRDPSLYAALRSSSTKSGVTFAQVVKPGIENRGHRMIKTAGIVAGDAESYSTFAPLFESVVGLRYAALAELSAQPRCLDASRVDASPIDPDHLRVVGVQVRLSRNLAALRFPSACGFDERREVERLIAGALAELGGELEGSYYPLAGSCSCDERPDGMDSATEAELEERRVLFYEPDSSLAISSGICRDWPDARGVFASAEGGFWAWVNEEDHLRLHIAEEGDDLRGAFGRISLAESALRQALQQAGHRFAWSDRFGYLTTGPANLGSALSATVFARLPLLSARPDFRSICRRLQLTAHQNEIGVWALSNSDRLGSSEADQANAVIAGCRELVSMECQLERGQDVQVSPAPDWSEVPGLGSEEYPGFPTGECPEQLPDLSRHHSLAAEVLRGDPSLYDALKGRTTKSGVSFARVIKSGIDKQGHPMIKSVGAVAGDEESYEAFAPFFGEVLRLSHGGWTEEMSHRSVLDPSKVAACPLDLAGRCVQSVKIGASRNLRGFRLLPACDVEERRRVERFCAQSLASLGGRFSGEYLPLAGSGSWARMPQGMSADEAERLRSLGALFDEPTSGSMLASGVGRHWPDARGVFADRAAELVAFVNDEDHLHISVRRTGGDLRETFAAFCEAHAALEEALGRRGLGFMRSDRLGFLTTCPSMLGSAMQVHVDIRLPRLGVRGDFKSICRALQLDARQSGGADGDAATWQVTHRPALGMSEVALIDLVMRGCCHLARMEDDISREEPVVLPGQGPDSLPGCSAEECPEEMPEMSGHRSLMARVLCKDPSIFAALRDRRTPGGVGFALVVKSALDVLGNASASCVPPIGLVAGDADCYTTFSEVFAPALERFHGRAPPAEAHPSCHDAAAIAMDELSGDRRVVSVRFRLSRNLAGHRFPAACTSEGRAEVEQVLATCLRELSDDLAGDYQSLGATTPEQSKWLRQHGVGFLEPMTPARLAMGLGRDWPQARGVFVSSASNVAAQVNEEDHLVLVSIAGEDGARSAFERLFAAEGAIGEGLARQAQAFSRSEGLGFLTGMPEKLGTGLVVSVRLKLPRLGSGGGLPKMCDRLGLQLVAKAPSSVVEVANRATFGVSEAELVSATFDACAALLRAEGA